jgi:hypothetical protein
MVKKRLAHIPYINHWVMVINLLTGTYIPIVQLWWAGWPCHIYFHLQGGLVQSENRPSFVMTGVPKAYSEYVNSEWYSPATGSFSEDSPHWNFDFACGCPGHAMPLRWVKRPRPGVHQHRTQDMKNLWLDPCRCSYLKAFSWINMNITV